MFDKLVELIKSFGRAFIFWDVINPYQGGVILRLGKFHRLAKVGFNWIWPLYMEKIIIAPIAAQTLVVGPQSLVTKDHKQLVIQSVVTCVVDDVKKFLLEIQNGVSALDDAAPGAVADLVMSNTLEELEKMRLGLRLTNSIRELASPWGITIKKVQITDFSPMRSLRLLQHVTQIYPPSKEF